MIAMEKISRFQITRLNLSGFSNFAEEVDFPLDEVTRICGRNFTGKTSILEAVAYTVTGRTFFGNTRVDELYCEQNPSISVKMTLTADGKSHSLLRRRFRVKGRDETELTWDGSPIRQKQLDEMFGEPDLFLSLYNPLYFLEVLGPDGRTLLEKHLPPIEKEAVFSRLSEHDRELLLGESLLSPENTIKQLRKEARDCTAEWNRVKGALDLLEQQKNDAQKQQASLSSELAEIDREWRELTAKKDTGIDPAALQKRREELETDCEALLRQQAPDTGELDRRIHELEEELAEARAVPFMDTHQRELQEAMNQYGALGARYRQSAERMKNIRPGLRCPICRTAVTDENVQPIRQGFAEELAQIKEKGTALKKEISGLKALSEQEHRTFEEAQAVRIQKLSGEKEKLLEQRRRLMEAAQKRSEAAHILLQKYKTEIAALDRKLRYGNLSEAEYARECALSKQRTDYGYRLQSVRERDFPAEQKSLEEKLQKLEQRRGDLEARVTAASEFWFTQSEMQMEKLCTQNVSIRLHEVVKTTGEYKNVFRFAYKGRTGRLSRSERLRAGLEVTKLLQQLTGRCYPVAIDEADNVTDLPKPQGQAILALFRRGMPLSVQLGAGGAPIPIRKEQEKSAAA